MEFDLLTNTIDSSTFPSRIANAVLESGVSTKTLSRLNGSFRLTLNDSDTLVFIILNSRVTDKELLLGFANTFIFSIFALGSYRSIDFLIESITSLPEVSSINSNNFDPKLAPNPGRYGFSNLFVKIKFFSDCLTEAASIFL